MKKKLELVFSLKINILFDYYYNVRWNYDFYHLVSWITTF